MTKRIVVTGIPGVGSTNFCNSYANMADDFGLNISKFKMTDMILRMAQEVPQKPPVVAENLLNLHPEFLNALRDRAFDNIMVRMDACEQLGCDRSIIDMHSQFFWNDVFTNAYDWRHLNSIMADMYITLIEKPSTIKERQMTTAQGQSQDHDLRDLLLWQNTGVNIVNGWAANFGKPVYVLPGQQDPTTIESLLTNAFLIYFQMPMTDASSEADDRITQFKERLLDIGRQLTGLPTPLVDPRTIDIETGDGLSDREERAIRIQTVHRDMNWYIPQASDLIAYYPEGTTLSKGVSDESTRGYDTGKNAFVIYPNDHTSPFMDLAKQVFTSEDDFFDFFPEYMEKRLKELERQVI